ncbi:methyl-accepting chemotaxis protein [Aliarcobacter skirrowii]|uniref:methyl-accepting chemotaxis protein n=1 Tax=Aliarcobacter skirrowii TaxID=28200 RepID=UPI0029B0B229|nr:methyl-accepting chemotaxis protein [Aliarcobacter skirrowii]MDX4060267.1 methyl-accepting chemotaxis protein [Aliarcobacter skirrowii]
MFGAVSNRDLETINNYFNQFIKFISHEKNQFDYIESTGNKKLDLMFQSWNKEIKRVDKSVKDDMKVLGELVLTADKVEQGIYNCRIKASSSNPTIFTLKNTINNMLASIDEATSNILKVVDSYTKNDFTDSIDSIDKYKDQMRLLMESINLLGKTLENSARNNFENGEILEENSLLMSSSMNNLALKTGEQASSLEQTTRALEQITNITRENTKNAIKMANLGQIVKKSVFVGEDLAKKTANSMDDINTKIRAINESITVIDQIAFQTNILSLNAAVESATAGEAGKGFAVVAGEVRNLANRSAEAAKKIKTLVEEATLKADDGKLISSNMIKGYEELNNNIGQTIDIIEDVSKASKEQIFGIEQINQAVVLLDSVTKQNAIESEQVSSISKTVSKLAQKLLSDAKSKKFRKEV